MKVVNCVKTVKAYGKTVQFPPDVSDEEMKAALDKLDPDYSLKVQERSFKALETKLRAEAKEHADTLLSAQQAHCDRVCEAIEANKPKDPIRYKSFRATKIAEGDFNIVLES